MIIRNNSIQILRGLSVIAVILFHAFPKIFNTGYFGVDIFFIISGFVITPVIDHIIESKNKYKHLKIFYIKRFWRLMPALVITLIYTTVIFTLLGGVGYIKNTFYQAFYSYLSLGNTSAYKNLGNYFLPIQNPLVHTWSLSLEEQIYIGTPLALILFTKLSSKLNRINFFIISGTISFFANFIVIAQINSEFKFYSPHTRYWEFCIGSILHYIAISKKRNIMMQKLTNRIPIIFEKYSILPLILILMLVLFGPNNFIFILVVLIIFSKKLLFSSMKTNNRFLKSLSHLGDISYSLYLVHYPILWLFKHSPALEYLKISENNEIAILISLFAIYKIGLILHDSVEVNYRAKSYRDRPNKTKFIKLQILLIGICATGIWASSNYFFLTDTVLSRPTNQMDPKLGDKCPVIDSGGLCSYPGLGSKRILFIGDSHAGSISRTLISTGRNFGDVDIYLKSGCQYLSPSLYIEKSIINSNNLCFNYSQDLQSIVDQNRYDYIIASYRSSSLNNSSFSEEEYSRLKIESLLNLRNIHKSKLLLIGPVPEFPLNPDFFESNRLLIAGSENSPKYLNRATLIQSPFIESNFYSNFLSTNYPEVSYIDSIDIFCNDNTCSRWNNGWLYSDSDHLSTLGADFMRSHLEKGLLVLTKSITPYESH